MSTVTPPAVHSNTSLVENIIVAGVGVILASGAAVTLTMLGMFAAVVWLH